MLSLLPSQIAKVILNEEQLHPLTPSVLVENVLDAHSSELKEFCFQHPIAVVRGIASALDINLGVFSTKAVVDSHPDYAIAIRKQLLQPPDENRDPSGMKTWECYSVSSESSLMQYASYQAFSFKKSLSKSPKQKKMKNKKKGPWNAINDSAKYASRNPDQNKKKQPDIKFGTNVDLSCDWVWEEQLHEISKLPGFFRVSSSGNMLTHVGHSILGMNTVQMYLKVPGSRTSGHQEHNNFCSININVGPGDCEWFAVANEYWEKIQKLCENNGVNFLSDSWWPDIEECTEAGIPVFRFTQKPGDLVWSNCGCVHWVQATGYSNNVAWNVGPLKSRQYQLAMERYEWNKLQRYQSLVPMIHLSWNLARNIRVNEIMLFELIRVTLVKTMVRCWDVLDLVRSHDIEIKFHGREDADVSHCCGQCEVEVFNLLFVRKEELPYTVYCADCALKRNSNLEGLVCLQEYEMKELKEILDKFKLHFDSSAATCPVHSSPILT